MTTKFLVLVCRILFCPMFRLYGFSLVVPRRGDVFDDYEDGIALAFLVLAKCFPRFLTA